MKERFHKAVVQSREKKMVGPSLIACMDLPDLKKNGRFIDRYEEIRFIY